MQVRYTPKFLKKHPGLEEGEAIVEGVSSGKIKVAITNKAGRVFWAFFDPVELVNEALAQVPWDRMAEISALPAFKRLEKSED